jgi:hypothetical protein
LPKLLRTILAWIAPVAVLALVLFAVASPPAPAHAEPEQFVPADEPLHLIESERGHDDTRRRGILIPRRMKEILSYHKTALA